MPKHLIAPDGKPVKTTKAEAEKLAAAGARYISRDEYRRLANAQAGAQK